MANALRGVLKDKDGMYLLPYTDNLPCDTVPTASSEKYLNSGAIHAAISGKFAPTTHTHTMSQVDGFSTHTHTMSQVDGFSTHTHTMSQVDGLEWMATNVEERVAELENIRVTHGWGTRATEIGGALDANDYSHGLFFFYGSHSVNLPTVDAQGYLFAITYAGLHIYQQFIDFHNGFTYTRLHVDQEGGWTAWRRSFFNTPDYRKGVDRTSAYNSGWTAESDGWIYISIDSGKKLYVDEAEVIASGNSTLSLVPVKAGDIVKIGTSWNAPSVTISKLFFYPSR